MITCPVCRSDMGFLEMLNAYSCECGRLSFFQYNSGTPATQRWVFHVTPGGPEFLELTDAFLTHVDYLLIQFTCLQLEAKDLIVRKLIDRAMCGGVMES